MKRIVLHFYSQGNALCVGRPLENLTDDRARVSCSNCKKLQRQVRYAGGQPDWQGIYAELKAISSDVKTAARRLCPEWAQVKVFCIDGPPRFWIEIYIPAEDNRKRRSFGYDLGNKFNLCNTIQVLKPTIEERERIADFIAALAQEFKLRAFRTSAVNALVPIYDLKPTYRQEATWKR